MPALTISTDAPRRSVSPEGPPMSPITPTEVPGSPVAAPAANSSSSTSAHPAAAPAAPATSSSSSSTMVPPAMSLSHRTHPTQQTAAPAPPPEPLDFEDNADAIAIRSAISVLQLQRKKADQHIRLLRDSKDAAVADPSKFADQLATADRARSTADLPFKDAFTAQAIASCPQINWEQYAIVGEPLDRLQREQVTHPPETEPSVYSGGVYESKSAGPGQSRPEEYRGPLAAYSPWKDADKTARKPNGK